MKNRKVLIAVVGFALLLFVGILTSLSGSGTNPDDAPEDPSIREYSKYANVVGSTKTLLENLGGVVQYDMLSMDLHYFGRVNYDKYKKDSSTIVGFSLGDNITKKDSIITLEGNYGASNNDISVVIELLPNKRIKTSITDTATGNNTDTQLPSNSKFNQFISKLPIVQNQYTIEYSPKKDDVVVVLGDRNPTLYQQALDYIKSQVDDGSLEQKKITALFPPSTFGQ